MGLSCGISRCIYAFVLTASRSLDHSSLRSSDRRSLKFHFHGYFVRHDQVYSRKRQKNGTNKKMGHRYSFSFLFLLICFSPMCSHFCHSTTLNTGTWLHMPTSHRFDLKARAAVKRNLQTTYVVIDISLNVNIFSYHTFVLSMTDNLQSPSLLRILSSVVSSSNPLLLFRPA